MQALYPPLSLELLGLHQPIFHIASRFLRSYKFGARKNLLRPLLPVAQA